ncbi:MAG: UDP-galactopyranose mutase, partial [Clostridia bacterium]|nr:UDP-galactopyranose mutase [Clostridia bacterium]
GYTSMVEKMLDGIEVKLNTNYFDYVNKTSDVFDKVVFSGKIDEFFDYKYGKLEYRTVDFENFILATSDYQGNAVVNFTEREVPYTRIIEHKHFCKVRSEKTVISKEYPTEWEEGKVAYYPVNDEKNTKLYLLYKNLASRKSGVIFGGRLGEYKYYDMDGVIGKALSDVKKEMGR